MTWKNALWALMTLLATATAAYAFALIFIPESRSPFAQQLLAQRPWTSALHFLGSGLALAVGAWQFQAALRNRFRALHRWMGRIYLVAVAAGGGVSLVMAPQSMGGLPAQAGFTLLGVLWLAFTFMAWRHIVNGDVARHRAFMTRSYALALAAVTLRLYMPAAAMMGFSLEHAYPVIAWLAWVPNLLVAEWMLRGRRQAGLAGAVAA